jgi:two-component system, response regulator FlrC
MVATSNNVATVQANGVALPVMVSSSMRNVVSCAADVADTDATVLLLGESGTGKEVVARLIHELSRRSAGPWVSLSCGSLPWDRLEAELLGHESDPSAGTNETRIGRIEQANGGTLLLDEVSELPLPLQAKLLRVLQERQVDRVGGRQPIPVDIRVVATSNRDLRAEVVAGRFRADLYYRLCVFPIVVPPLRERREDIEALARHFVDRLSHVLGRSVPVLSASALVTLDSHSYSGNVRELRNLIERTLIRCRHSVLEPGDFFFDPSLPLPPDSSQRQEAQQDPEEAEEQWALPIDLGELERMAIREALRRVSGNRTHAARLLGISLRTLRNKLKAWREGGVVMELASETEVNTDAGPRHERDAKVAQSSHSKSNEQAA